MSLRLRSLALVSFVIAAMRRARHPGRLAIGGAFAFASHVLLDWLGSDASPPIGIMALWPFSSAYYESELHVFMAISRRYYQGWAFVEQNGRAVELGARHPASDSCGGHVRSGTRRPGRR